MSISDRFAVALHILAVLEINRMKVNTSESIAASVNTNPVIIRKITGMLKQAGLVKSRPGVAGTELAADLSTISLLDVYKAVHVVQEKELFSIHANPNPNCLVGRNIQDTIGSLFTVAQLALEKVLASLTMEDVVSGIIERENSRTDSEALDCRSIRPDEVHREKISE
ncbi:Rrf2 family transcriptional regulator [Paenibacillus sp. P26]|nr:Rrf2 family transcriptional regulator [Paenibacillus sp. P26]UUZ91976.1 Rrf2 family transcriptional regulator [Paenibacillus sp. P25]